MAIKAGIVGAAGYTGGELLRILLHHPQVQVAWAQSNSQAGKALGSVHGDLLGETALRFSAGMDSEVDVLFLCSGHGEARKFLEAHDVPAHTRIIDLSNDFRLAQHRTCGAREFVYGLPELNRDTICQARNIANPGCFATAIQLSLLPLARAGLLTQVYTTGITGSTGAGQALAATSHFSWRANNIQSYKTLTHQHLGEITESLLQLQPSPAPRIHFVPWRGDFTRGIFVSSTLPLNIPAAELKQLYADYYKDHVFTLLTEEPLFLKQVVNTNKCLLQLEQQGDTVVVHAAIDNLLKGASGQAVQNMNLMFGWAETEGLKLKAAYF